MNRELRPGVMEVYNDFNLKNRGVEDIFIACTDNLTGFSEAIEATFPKTDIQNCIIHQLRNSSKYVSYKDVKALMVDLKEIYTAVDEPSALTALDAFSAAWDKKYPQISKSNWSEKYNEFARIYKTVKDLELSTYCQRQLCDRLYNTVYQAGCPQMEYEDKVPSKERFSDAMDSVGALMSPSRKNRYEKATESGMNHSVSRRYGITCFRSTARYSYAALQARALHQVMNALAGAAGFRSQKVVQARVRAPNTSCAARRAAAKWPDFRTRAGLAVCLAGRWLVGGLKPTPKRINTDTEFRGDLAARPALLRDRPDRSGFERFVVPRRRAVLLFLLRHFDVPLFFPL